MSDPYPEDFENFDEEGNYIGDDEPDRTINPTRVVRGRIVLEGFYNPDVPYDEDDLRYFIVTKCGGDSFEAEFAVRPEWIEVLDD